MVCQKGRKAGKSLKQQHCRGGVEAITWSAVGRDVDPDALDDVVGRARSELGAHSFILHRIGALKRVTDAPAPGVSANTS